MSSIFKKSVLVIWTALCTYHKFLVSACKSVGCTGVICLIPVCPNYFLFHFPHPSPLAAIMRRAISIDIL